MPVSCSSDHGPSAAIAVLVRENNHFGEFAAVNSLYEPLDFNVERGNSVTALVKLCILICLTGLPCPTESPPLTEGPGSPA